MATLLKDLFSPHFYERLSDSFLTTIPSFNKQKFLNRIFDDRFESLALKERMRHTSSALHDFMPEQFRDAARLLPLIISRLQKDGFNINQLEFMFFPDYIETYGIDDFEHAVQSIEYITQFVSCEFAVRPFLLKYGDSMIRQMVRWSLHKNAQVRRLASEGSRPRLPWAMAIPRLKKDPSPILPILENLKNDPSESVRRSVANSLNDISKDHPELVIEFARKWKGHSAATDQLVKHASRTLLKKGHGQMLKHFSLVSKQLQFTGLKIKTPKVSIGERLGFQFTVQNGYKHDQLVRFEYAIYYRKLNGTLSKKVFKISERVMKPGEIMHIIREQSFKRITTRTFYAGRHEVSVILNGEEKGKAGFTLLKAL